MSNVNGSVRQAVNLMTTAKTLKKRKTRLVRQRTRERLLSLHKCAAKWLTVHHTRKASSIRSRSPLNTDISPFMRFRRIARAVALLVKICNVCKRIVYESVASEDWFALIDRFVEGDDKFFEDNTAPRPRPFITFVVNDDRDEDLTQLSFDKSEFSRENRSDHLLTADVREILKISPGLRTIPQQNEVVRFLRRLSTEFNAYPMDIQRRLAKCLYYDKYYPSRVLAREGLMADMVFFVISGTVVAKSSERRSLRELRPGDRYGEQDIVCGCPRRSTAVTKTTVELLSVHRIDYRVIFNMADDSNNPSYLDICRHDVVFQHFPMKKLIENSGTWAVLSYKFGRLMVKDSNAMDWIYIIKSGEARVLKHMETAYLDVDARKKKKQQQISANRDAMTRKMIDFIGGKHSVSSEYKSGTYTPRITSNRFLSSAPNTNRLNTESTPRSMSQHTFNPPLIRTPRESTEHLDAARAENLFRVRPQSQPLGCQEKASIPSNFIGRSMTLSRNETRVERLDVNQFENMSISSNTSSKSKAITIVLPDNETPSKTKAHSGFIQTPVNKANLPALHGKPRAAKEPHVASNVRRVPPFVQLECIRAGKVFGLRACLNPEERGPSVSLVSAGCEVLQINKKFFLKHADEAVMGLIRAMYKAFPSEEDMLERLDDSLQWQEYRQTTVLDFLKEKGRPSTQYSTVQTTT